MVRELRQNLAKCRKVLVDESLDLKIRERWTQLYNNTSTVLNQVLRDRRERDWELRLRELEEYEGNQATGLLDTTDKKEELDHKDPSPIVKDEKESSEQTRPDKETC